MKVVLFCGGYGTRIREYSDRVPKPLVPIGNRPILWHIMKYYAAFGHRDFILCLGYQGEAIKRYFLDYEETLTNDFVLRGDGDLELMGQDIDDWKISFVDTGLESDVGERLRRVRHLLQDEEMFLVNYSDGLTDHHLPELIDQVRATDSVGGFLTVQPPLNVRAVRADADGVVQAFEDIRGTSLRVNGGYFAFTSEFWNYLHPGDDLVQDALCRVAEADRLTSIPYDGFWMPMDTFREQQQLEEMYARGDRPWEVWERKIVPHPRLVTPEIMSV